MNKAQNMIKPLESGEHPETGNVLYISAGWP